jgi:hypothetical protein
VVLAQMRHATPPGVSMTILCPWALGLSCPLVTHHRSPVITLTAYVVPCASHVLCPDLGKALETPDPATRRWAAWAVEQLVTGSRADFRQQVMTMTMRMRMMMRMIRMLRMVVVMIMTTLRMTSFWLQVPVILRYLVPLLNDPDPEVLRAAVTALKALTTSLGLEEVIPTDLVLHTDGMIAHSIVPSKRMGDVLP